MVCKKVRFWWQVLYTAGTLSIHGYTFGKFVTQETAIRIWLRRKRCTLLPFLCWRDYRWTAGIAECIWIVYRKLVANARWESGVWACCSIDKGEGNVWAGLRLSQPWILLWNTSLLLQAVGNDARLMVQTNFNYPLVQLSAGLPVTLLEAYCQQLCCPDLLCLMVSSATSLVV